MNDISSYDRNELVYLDSDSFKIGVSKYSDSKKFELDRLSNNRIIRKKIKDLKDKKSSMSRSEVIKSGIVKEISELKKSIG
jgi:hypothetical protein